jgi:hypothetical protein
MERHPRTKGEAMRSRLTRRVAIIAGTAVVALSGGTYAVAHGFGGGGEEEREERTRQRGSAHEFTLRFGPSDDPTISRNSHRLGRR